MNTTKTKTNMKKLVFTIAIMMSSIFVFAQEIGVPYLIKDINPGTGGAWSGDAYFAEWKDNLDKTYLFFNASNGDAVNGEELWRSDGTAAGTYMVKDINAGAASSKPAQITLANNQNLVFTADNGATGPELFGYNFVKDSLYLIKDIVPGTNHDYIMEITKVAGSVLFTSSASNSYRYLWKTDLTTGGTIVLDTIYFSNNISAFKKLFITQLNPSTSEVFIGGSNFSGTKKGLLKVNYGTNTTEEIYWDLNMLSYDYPENLYRSGSKLYFTVNTNWDTFLYVSDGTTAGTSQIATFSSTGGVKLSNNLNKKRFFILIIQHYLFV